MTLKLLALALAVVLSVPASLALLRPGRAGDSPGELWAEGRCLSYGHVLPYHLLIDLLRSLAAWGGVVRTDVARGDVARLYPGAGQNQGFSRTFTAGPGTQIKLAR